MKHSLRIKSWLACGCVALALSQSAVAAEVSGVKLDDTVRLGNTDLKLNGAGVRTKVIFKVYVAALYMTDKKTVPAEVLALAGPKRVAIVMQRDISSEDFRDAFMKGLDDNTDQAEKSKIASQTAAFGDMFASIPGLKKGENLTLDWVPEVGTQVTLNGKPIAKPLPDVAFFNALLKIWIGDKPVDNSLKTMLLGEKT